MSAGASLHPGLQGIIRVGFRNPLAGACLRFLWLPTLKDYGVDRPLHRNDDRRPVDHPMVLDAGVRQVDIGRKHPGRFWRPWLARRIDSEQPSRIAKDHRLDR